MIGSCFLESSNGAETSFRFVDDDEEKRGMKLSTYVSCLQSAWPHRGE